MRVLIITALWVVSFACEDGQKRCAEWARGGECEKNREFMLGETNPMPSFQAVIRRLCSGRELPALVRRLLPRARDGRSARRTQPSAVRAPRS